MKPDPCDQFVGRVRDVCRGYDAAGQPVLTLVEVNAYRAQWGLPPQTLDAFPAAVDPSLAKKGTRYARAVARWIKAGRPVRTAEEVERIHTEHCLPCEWLNQETSSCRRCGCKVSRSKKALVNKVRVATESCPVKRW